MSDFDPVTVFFIVRESMGAWLWPLLALAVMLLIGFVASALKLRRAGQSVKRPILAALVVGLVVAVAATFIVPGWTLADVSALGAAVDYVFAFLFALVPGTIVAVLVFILTARRASRGTATT